MNFPVVQWIIGVLLMLFSVTMLPPVAVALIYDDGGWLGFLGALLVIAGSGLTIWLPVRKQTRKQRENLRLRDGFMVVAGFWTVLGLFGAVPLMMTLDQPLTVANAVFESMSGLTTTGATVLVGLDQLPKSVLFYRQQLQWLGGMGIIVLAVAVLPMLGVGGMQLYRAETPGPVKDTKLTPRITETAKYLWLVYLGITVACALAYWAAGMDLFDAIGHSFATVAIGGFSTHDASFAYFASDLIDMIAVVFMFIAGVNFSLHFAAFRRGGRVTTYFADPEFRAYVLILFMLTLIVFAYLYLSGEYATVGESFTKGIFQSVSIATTTGFLTADYASWPGSLPVLLILVSFIGGCAGSTGGGMKVVRWLLIYKQGVREVMRLVHPRSEIPVKLGSVAISSRVVESVWGFFAVYVVLFGTLMLVLMMTGLDQVTAFSAVAASLNNLGPGMGEVAANYASISPAAKWVLVAAMLLGRLEIFTLLVLFTPTFWRR